MLPHKKPRGREALKRVMCFNTIPASLEKEKITDVPGASGEKLRTKYVELSTIIKRIGGKL